jgi:hypothetical protein
MEVTMKKIIILALATLAEVNAFGATVISARLDAERKYILVDVTYSGGCRDHHFSLKVGHCLRTQPAQCKAELIDSANDPCKAFISNTVVIPLAEYGLTDPFFKDGSIVITGDKDLQTNQPSLASVRLPN